MNDYLISSEAGILAVLAAVASVFFFLEHKTKAKFFSYLPPLIFIYLIPVLFSNIGVIPNKAGVYDFMGANVLPAFIVILLLNVDLYSTVKVMGKGIFVMLLGTLGVVVGAPVGFAIVSSFLGPEAWKGYGALAGSWIGGTANMLAVGQMIDLNESSLDFGYAVIADNVVYFLWLPLMLAARNYATRFHKFTGVSDDRLAKMEDAAKALTTDKGRMEMRHILYLIAIGMGVTAFAAWVAGMIDPIKTADGQTLVTANTYKILCATIIGILLSFTKANRIPGSHGFAMALVYLFVARMGAKADLSNLDWSVLWFVAGAYIWIFIHGAFLVGAAKLFKVDVHTAAIASAANIGGAASAPIVAAYHKPALVPVSVLMALIGYAVGNPAAWVAAMLCKWVS